jgi:RNA polymerase sigma factor (sigma-70 family)
MMVATSADIAEGTAAPRPRTGAGGATGVGSLVRAALDGDRRAWEELVGRFSPLLWAIARGYGLSRDDAAEVVQTTWLRCVERLDQIRDPDRVAGWLVTICRRESLAVLRREARAGSRTAGDPAEAIAALPDPRIGELTEPLIAEEEAILLRDAISRLDDRPRQVLLALLEIYEDGGGYASVARRLDLPIGSIGPTRQRALTTLRTDPTLRGVGPSQDYYAK